MADSHEASFAPESAPEAWYPWQQDVLDMIDREPDERRIFWYWSATGKSGKSRLLKWIVSNRQDLAPVFNNGSSTSELKKFIVNTMRDNGGEYPGVVLYDVSRSSVKRFNYDFAESVKDALFFYPTKESSNVIGSPPHVVVLACSPPDMTKISAERWIVKCVE